jgi:hypothetical protein
MPPSLVRSGGGSELIALGTRKSKQTVVNFSLILRQQLSIDQVKNSLTRER